MAEADGASLRLVLLEVVVRTGGLVRRLILLPVILAASSAWGGANKEVVLRDLGPERRLAVCNFELFGATGSNWSFFFGLVGAVIDANNAAKGMPYAQELASDFLRVYETAMDETGAFRLAPLRSLVLAKGGKPLSLTEAVKENDLFACVSARTGLSSSFGWKKKVVITTQWRIAGMSGWELSLTTETKSEESQGVFPDTRDPKMKPLLLPLARENVRQFLVQLAEMMRRGGATAEVKIPEPEEEPAGTVVDPGALPQPEPGVALNDDKKWEKRVEISPGIELALVYVPNGSFTMGSRPEVKDEDSQPQHPVTIGRAFWLGKYEVTQAQWKAVTGKNPSVSKGDALPVENVSWNDSLAFLAAINQRLGFEKDKGFRLPTEAEWEYACRAGTLSNYSFGDSKKNLAKYAWFDESSKKTPHAVGQLLPSPWGAYDMYGNVSEWCEDVWHSHYKGAPGDGTAWGGNDEDRAHRGGHWDRSATKSRSHSRDHDETKKGDRTIGLRVVLPTLNPQTLLPTPTPSVSAVTSVEPGGADARPVGAPVSTLWNASIKQSEEGAPKDFRHAPVKE